MGETLLLITITTLVILTIRRAKPVVLENPVVIQRPGQYHITLAPQLNQAQSFVEHIAKQFAQSNPPRDDIPSQYFEIRDPKVFPKGFKCYLLAITMREGFLFFQAASPKKDKPDNLETVREFADTVLKQHPHNPAEKEQDAGQLMAAINEVASRMQVGVKPLQ